MMPSTQSKSNFHSHVTIVLALVDFLPGHFLHVYPPLLLNTQFLITYLLDLPAS